MPHDEMPQRRDSLMPVMIVVAVVLALVVSVVALAGWAGVFVIAAIASVLGFAAMHYILWGWWLTKRIHESDREPDTDESK